MVNLYNQIQHLSGGGQEDDEEEEQSGGGDGALSGAYDTLVGTADHLAGSTDEAVARTFDDEAGGGIGEGFGEFVGVDEFQESDTGRNLRADYRGASGPLERFDIATRAGLDFLMDNPQASVQDTVRGGIEAATGEEDVGGATQAAATQYREATSGALEGTPFDNPVTGGAVTVFDALVADPAKAGLRGLTGIDIDTGREEGTVGAVDAFDIGVTAATAGAGKAGLAGARTIARSDEAVGFVDEAGQLVRRLTGGGDEGAAILDDTGAITGQAGRAADETAQAADESGSAIDFDVLDEAAGATVSGADEAAQAGTDIFGRFTGQSGSPGLVDGLLGVGDDAAATAARIGDDLAARIGGFTDDATARFGRGADEAAQLTDEAAQAADEGAGGLRGILSTRRGHAAAAGAGILGAGAVATALRQEDELEVTDPETGDSFTLVKTKDYRPTEDHPEGATLWRVDTTDGSQGYTIILEVQGRNVYIMGRDGGRRRAQVSAETLRNAVRNRRAGAA